MSELITLSEFTVRAEEETTPEIRSIGEALGVTPELAAEKVAEGLSKYRNSPRVFEEDGVTPIKRTYEEWSDILHQLVNAIFDTAFGEPEPKTPLEEVGLPEPSQN